MIHDPRIDPLVKPALGGLTMAHPILDEDDDEIVGTILTRRQALATVGKAGLGLGLLGGLAGSGVAQRGVKTPSLVATPQVTEGPFFVDERLFRSNVVVNYASSTIDRTTTVAGAMPLVLNVQVLKVVGTTVAPYAGLYFDIWSADAGGAYSDEPQGLNPANTQGLTYGRGYQVTDAKGTVAFKTYWPSWYNGRTPHLHFKIRAYNSSGNATSTFTSQFFFDDALSDAIFQSAPYVKRTTSGGGGGPGGGGGSATYNATDNVYSALQADGTMVGSHLLLSVSKNPVAAGYVGTFIVGLTA